MDDTTTNNIIYNTIMRFNNTDTIKLGDKVIKNNKKRRMEFTKYDNKIVEIEKNNNNNKLRDLDSTTMDELFDNINIDDIKIEKSQISKLDDRKKLFEIFGDILNDNDINKCIHKINRSLCVYKNRIDQEFNEYEKKWIRRTSNYDLLELEIDNTRINKCILITIPAGSMFLDINTLNRLDYWDISKNKLSSNNTIYEFQNNITTIYIKI